MGRSSAKQKQQSRQPIDELPRHVDPLLRLNGLCPYYTMFPLAFPFRTLRRADPGHWLIDPFCGRGTSNFAARLRGIPSVGIDSDPVAAAIARAKLVDAKPGFIIRTARQILEDEHDPAAEGLAAADAGKLSDGDAFFDELEAQDSPSPCEPGRKTA